MPPQSETGRPKRAIIYCRQSKDKRDGIERQIEKCAKLVADRGWDLVHAPFTDNDVSATKRKRRPVYEQAMSMVKAGQCDVLVVSHMDRLYRKVIELEGGEGDPYLGCAQVKGGWLGSGPGHRGGSYRFG
jgi:predicted site-specific integrase-resolvase